MKRSCQNSWWFRNMWNCFLYARESGGVSTLMHQLARIIRLILCNNLSQKYQFDDHDDSNCTQIFCAACPLSSVLPILALDYSFYFGEKIWMQFSRRKIRLYFISWIIFGIFPGIHSKNVKVAWGVQNSCQHFVVPLNKVFWKANV